MSAIKDIFNKINRSKAWISILHSIICVLLAVIICTSCALVYVYILKKHTEVDINGSVAENEKIRIYIDQGHNPSPYHNTGAEGNGLLEQDLTFSIGHLLADLLQADGRFEVCLSRENEDTVLGSDNRSSLAARVDGAESFEADYFISLHINSYTNEDVRGIEVFASDGDDTSYHFGNSLLQGMEEATDLKNRGMKLSSELYVLENTTMPAVLLEMGFISNADDAELLSEQPELFAQGIYNGIVDHFGATFVKDINILLCITGISVLLLSISIAVVFVIKRKSKVYSA